MIPFSSFLKTNVCLPMFARVLVLGMLSTLLAAAQDQAFSGRAVLKDASNSDRTVGPSVSEGIPQGHVLKICLEEGKHGRQLAKGQAVTVEVRHGSQEKTRVSGTLDANGYVELLVQVGDDWSCEVYQVKLVLQAASKKKESDQETGLGATFRVVEGEPGPHIPELWPFAVGLLLIGLTVFWWRRAKPKAKL